MGEQLVERRLVGILAADVVGYSRLMSANEVGTLRMLKSLRKEIVDPALTTHGGRIVKLTGDGILVEFASVVDAVACAVELQRAMAGRNADMQPERRIEYRAGINIGDVIVDGEDIYGDGVNVAARLEALAEPGGVWISGAVYEQVRDKLPYTFADKGEQAVKNIARPVHVYALNAEAVAALSGMEPFLAAPRSARRWKSRQLWPPLAGVAATLLVAAGVWIVFRPAHAPHELARVPNLSFVVLPFTNLSGDPSQGYLADVITDELTTSLSRIRGSFVIARSTAFTFKGKAVDVKQIGRDLGVRYVLEGSAEQGGDRVRVNAQLISAETGAHLWADQFDTARADLLTMQDEIVTRLARALEVETTVIQAARVARARPENQDAEDLALRCAAGAVSPLGSAGKEAARSLCKGALNIDGRNVLALSLTALKYAGRVRDGLSADRQADIRKAEDMIDRTLTLEPDNYRAHFAKSIILSVQQRYEEGLVEAESSLALNPGYVPAYTGVWLANFRMGRPDKALEAVDRAIRLSPRDPILFAFYLEKGLSHAMLKEDAQAIESLRRAAALAPQSPPVQWALAAELALNGQKAEAHEVLQRYLSIKATRLRTIAQFDAYAKTTGAYSGSGLERVLQGLREAGMPEQ